MPSTLHETTSSKTQLSLSTISHELRNPLTLIHSTLQLLGCHHPEIKADPLWYQLTRDIQYMTELLSELSSLNKCQALQKTDINIRQFLTDIATLYLPTIHSQKKSLTLNIQTPIETFSGDALKIKEVFMNLLKNALEATEEGDNIVIVAKSKWNRLVFTVSDSGQGIDEEKRNTIFEPFITYKSDGTGLGLTIVRNIVKAHGGTVRVYSKPGIGSKFIIIFPVDTTDI